MPHHVILCPSSHLQLPTTNVCSPYYEAARIHFNIWIFQPLFLVTPKHFFLSPLIWFSSPLMACTVNSVCIFAQRTKTMITIYTTWKQNNTKVHIWINPNGYYELQWMELNFLWPVISFSPFDFQEPVH